MRSKVLLLVLMLGTTLRLPASEEAYVRRGTPQRQGRVWVEQAECGIPVKEGGRLFWQADAGSVFVSPGASDQVKCQVRLVVYSRSEADARTSLGRYELTVRKLGGGGAYISGKFPYESRRARTLEVSFRIQAPLRFNLELETQGGGVEVEKLDGELRAVTAGGDIRTGDITGPVQVRTAGGAIDLGNVAKRVEAHTAGGGIRVGDVKEDARLETSGGEIVIGSVGGSLRAETAGGDITLRAASGPVVVETAGGQIELGQCGNSVQAETAGGSIHLAGARGLVRAETAGGSLDLLQLQSAVRAQTAAGRILAQISADRSTFGSSELETSVGDVQVFLPPNLPLMIDAAIEEAAGHKIFSDFPLNIEGMEEFGGSVRAHGALLGGGQILRLHTSMGNIEIRKLDEKAASQLKAYEASFWKHWQAQWQEHEAEIKKRMERIRRMQEQWQYKVNDQDNDNHDDE